MGICFSDNGKAAVKGGKIIEVSDTTTTLVPEIARRDIIDTILSFLEEYERNDDKKIALKLYDPIFAEVNFDLTDPDIKFNVKIDYADRITMKPHDIWAKGKSDPKVMIINDEKHEYKCAWEKHADKLKNVIRKCVEGRNMKHRMSLNNKNIIEAKSEMVTDGGQFLQFSDNRVAIQNKDNLMYWQFRVDVSNETLGNRRKSGSDSVFEPRDDTVMESVRANGSTIWQKICRGTMWLKLSRDNNMQAKGAEKDLVGGFYFQCIIQVDENDFHPDLVRKEHAVGSESAAGGSPENR